MNDRISYDELFTNFAHDVAKRSTCTRLSVGCVIVKDTRIISMGYNGNLPGLAHCIDVGCDIDEQTGGCIRTVHAEVNAITWAAREGIPILGATIYLTHAPCLSCAKLIASAGIKDVKYDIEYRKTEGVDLLRLLGIV